MNLSNYIYVFEKKKNWGCNHATVYSIIPKLRVCDMEYHYRNISKIHNGTLIFQSRKKNWTNLYGICKIDNSFEIREKQ